MTVGLNIAIGMSQGLQKSSLYLNVKKVEQNTHYSYCAHPHQCDYKLLWGSHVHTMCMQDHIVNCGDRLLLVSDSLAKFSTLKLFINRCHKHSICSLWHCAQYDNCIVDWEWPLFLYKMKLYIGGEAVFQHLLLLHSTEFNIMHSLLKPFMHSLQIAMLWF